MSNATLQVPSNDKVESVILLPLVQGLRQDEKPAMYIKSDKMVYGPCSINLSDEAFGNSTLPLLKKH